MIPFSYMKRRESEEPPTECTLYADMPNIILSAMAGMEVGDGYPADLAASLGFNQPMVAIANPGGGWQMGGQDPVYSYRCANFYSGDYASWDGYLYLCAIPHPDLTPGKIQWVLGGNFMGEEEDALAHTIIARMDTPSECWQYNPEGTLAMLIDPDYPTDNWTIIQS